MLLAFSVENFRSIRELQTLSLTESRADPHLEWSNLFEAGNRRVVKTAAIFGANASGKSNVLRAILWLREFVLASSKEGQVGEPIHTHPFRLSTAWEHEPSHFEVELFLDGHEYRYGCEVTARRVESEWLFRKRPKSKPAMLFTREGQKISLSGEFFKEGKGLEWRTRENALFLSVCAQWNGLEAAKIVGWMRRLRGVSGLTEVDFFGFTAKRLTDDRHRKGILELAQKADFNISDLRSDIKKLTEAELPPELPDTVRERILTQDLARVEIKATREKRDGDGKVVGGVEFDLKEDESDGTQKFIALAGPVTHALEEGSILVVDELEARLHPLLTQAVVDLFHSPVNRKSAQLIFAAHDVSLLDPGRFRRDQIWFVEKNGQGATELYPLSEFDPAQVRAGSNFSRQYMLGLFGALPKLGHFQNAAANAIQE